MKRGYLGLILLVLFIAGCGGTTMTCTEGFIRCSSDHLNIQTCIGGSYVNTEDCSVTNHMCKVVNGSPQCVVNNAPVVDAGIDFSVTGNNGDLVNFDFDEWSGWVSGTGWAEAKIGDALLFDGYDDFIEIPDSTMLDFTDKVTISAWVNFDWAGNLWDMIIAKEGVGERAFGMWINEDTDEILLSYKGEDLNYYNFKVPGHNRLEWNHIVGVIDTVNDYMEIYINGVGYRNDISLPPIRLNNYPVRIGGDMNNYYTPFGVIDEVAILNDAISADAVNEIYQIYQSGIRPQINDVPNLQAYYSFDEGSGAIVNDLTGTIGKIITLDATATDPDDDILTYSWSVVSAPTNDVEYGDEKTLNPWFIPSVEGIYTIRLTANDGVTIAYDDISILVGDGITTECNDGIDNDGDGLIDMNDPGCIDANDNDEIDPLVIYECSDGMDNDVDSEIDDLDPGCYDINQQYNSLDDDESNSGSPFQCSNNIDDDSDGLIDYPNDQGCTNLFDNDEIDIVVPQTCNDGTLYGSCSTNKPLFCDNGNLVNDCQNCGCSSGLFCQGDGSCTADRCITLVNNGDPSTKLDVLYIGDDYTQADLITFANDVTRFKNGLLSYEPFASQSNKINFYRIDNINDLGCSYNCAGGQSICCDMPKINQESVYCPHDQIIVIVNNNQYGGYAYFNIGPAYSYRGDSKVGVHEFGHSFGGLHDEYSFGRTSGSTPENRANCAWDNVCSEWSDLIGVEGVGCFQTCGYTDWYRPIQYNTMMLDLGGDFNPVGKRALEQKMGVYL
jgi:hypothetical protein